MHDVEIPREVTDRIIERRGRLHVFDSLDGPRTALIVIDMQTAFLAEGMPSEVPAARGIVPNINRLADAVRLAGGGVFWVQATFPRTEDGGWPTFYRDLVPPDRAARILENLSEGGEGHPLWPALDVREGDPVVRKNRFSPFVRGASDIEARLAERGIDTVLITGTMTNVCCESAARDAMQLGYRTLIVSDSNAARSDAEHLATLITFILTFGDVQTTDEVIAMLEADRASRAAAE